MSDQILFDKLVYVDRLKRAGISDEQARAHAEAIDEALRESVATRGDLAAVRADLTATRNDLQRAILEVEYRLTVRGGLMSAAVVAILASIKYFG